MWPLPVSVRTLALAVIGLSVIAAAGSLGYQLGRASGDRDVRKMLEAGQAVIQKRDALIAHNLEVYREDLAALSARKPKRVFLCPSGGVPETPGGTDGADPAGTDRRDYGPLLREARDALVRCNALIETVR